MRQLTFKGFLYQYVRAVGKHNTNDIKVLADEVSNNKRLVEPLILYAMSLRKQEYLQRVAHDSCTIVKRV